MKTTIELPDTLFRRLKSTAAARGMTLKQFLTEAIQEKLAGTTSDHHPAQPPWMNGFGKLRKLHKETVRIQGVIDAEFDAVEPEDLL